LDKKRQAAKLLGKFGGEATSAAKAKSSRENGAKGGRPKKKDTSLPPSLGPALELINQIESEGLIVKATIGGSLAIIYYSQPQYTEDMDIFFYPDASGIQLNLGPIYSRLEELGCKIDGSYVHIKGVKVQFLGPGTGIAVEALQHARPITVDGVPTRVFEYEYALAVKAEAGRPKDWGHITTALESAEPDQKILYSILSKHNLLEKWKRKTEE